MKRDKATGQNKNLVLTHEASARIHEASARIQAWQGLALWIANARSVIGDLRQTAYKIVEEAEGNPSGAIAQALPESERGSLRDFANHISDVESYLCNVVPAANVAIPNPLAAVKGGA
jgi:hypothetical protein